MTLPAGFSCEFEAIEAVDRVDSVTTQHQLSSSRTEFFDELLQLLVPSLLSCSSCLSFLHLACAWLILKCGFQVRVLESRVVGRGRKAEVVTVQCFF